MSDQDKSVRKSLKTLQSTAQGLDILVGRNLSNLKQQLLTASPAPNGDDNEVPVQLTPKEVEICVGLKTRASESPPLKEPLVNKDVSVQVEFTNKITVEDLTNPKDASSNYWKTLAGKQQHTIESLLEEKHRMKKRVEELEQEIILYKQMLEEASSFVDVIKEMANDDNNDTGIDMSVSALEDEEAEATQES